MNLTSPKPQRSWGCPCATVWEGGEEEEEEDL